MYRVGVVFYIRVSREGIVDVLAFAQFRQRGLLVGAVDVLHSVVQLVGQLQPLDGDHGVVLLAVLGAFGGGPPQHHLRVVEKILVDREAFLGPAGLRPVRGNVQRTVPLLQEENIRNDLSSGICLERIVWQADGSQQLGTELNNPVLLYLNTFLLKIDYHYLYHLLDKNDHICLLYTSRCV